MKDETYPPWKKLTQMINITRQKKEKKNREKIEKK